MRKYRKYSDQDIIEAAKKATSMSKLLSALDLRPTGGNYVNMKRNLQRLAINCDHWTGQAWNRDQQLKDWSDYTRVVNLKPHLIKERSHKCEGCNNTHWQKQSIPLEVHHVNGDRTDNEYQNLLLLCPNCHALTDNWRNRKSGPVAE